MSRPTTPRRRELHERLVALHAAAGQPTYRDLAEQVEGRLRAAEHERARRTGAAERSLGRLPDEKRIGEWLRGVSVPGSLRDLMVLVHTLEDAAPADGGRPRSTPDAWAPLLHAAARERRTTSPGDPGGAPAPSGADEPAAPAEMGVAPAVDPDGPAGEPEGAPPPIGGTEGETGTVREPAPAEPGGAREGLGRRWLAAAVLVIAVVVGAVGLIRQRAAGPGEAAESARPLAAQAVSLDDPSCPERIGRGTDRACVAELQRLLGKVGLPVAPSGVFDAETERAVTTFKTRIGLQPDPWVGALTKERLYAPDLPWPALTAPECAGPLAVGARSGCLVTVQQALRACADPTLPVDGEFGPRTQAALSRFLGGDRSPRATVTIDDQARAALARQGCHDAALAAARTTAVAAPTAG